MPLFPREESRPTQLPVKRIRLRSQALLAFAGSSAETPRWIMILGSFLTLGVFPVWRLAVAAALSGAIPFRKVLFLGAPLGPLGPADEIAVLLKHRPEIGLAAVGYLGDKSGADAVPYVGGMNEFEAIFQEHAPSRIVFRERRAIFPWGGCSNYSGWERAWRTSPVYMSRSRAESPRSKWRRSG